MISLIVPCFNEAENIPSLVTNIKNVFENSKYSNEYELILINDASKDNSEDVMKNYTNETKHFSYINLKSNYGKATALDVGILNSKGDIICIMDGDLQYDPLDIIKMIDMIKSENVDLINGRRTNRKDKKNIKFFSELYNKVISFITGSKIKDHFSGIKIFKKKIYQNSDYGGIARFMVLIANKFNFKILEIDVNHFLRNKGKSAYNFFDRIILSLKDIFCIIFCIVFSKENLYQFKQLTLVILIFFIFLILVFLKFDYNLKIISIPLVVIILIAIFNYLVENFMKKKVNDKNTEVILSFIKNISK
tara:strand:+ start:2351 stop:3268 length:918 start_codon:yes stop_codon:yes gene_type:complete